MNVKTLIEVLTKEVKKEDRESAEIEVWCENENGESQEYEIVSMGGFSLSPDITITIKPIESAICKPMVFKKEHSKMVRDTVKKNKKRYEGEIK